MRIDDALIWAQFALVNSDSALLDAQVLLAFVLQKETVYLLTWPEEDLAVAQKEQFEALILQRINGVPVAHLTGIREFWSLPLKVNNSTLIPRPDTEVLVEAALNIVAADAKILDLGTGTGAIILALASELPNASCTGIDFSDKAVNLAKENAQQLNIKNVQFKQSNWFENITGQFDLIVSNPPYIDKQDDHLKQGDLRFEPLSALVSEQEGLADIQLIAQQAPQYLAGGGFLLIEHGYKQAVAVSDILHNLHYQQIKTIKDYGGNDRVTVALFNHSKQNEA
ncbi:peptide chain release factor N(5)-glutamine methyltransferase [Psychromonas antarctica]|uniref:peptide chain release factor N(5)-glutamine methyltransferase n=1 Tax=Psychromonas antarctica TaxID=67573 RepID=UPI001EE93C73|nr:peptide chain release factor N(5)-glutamine methyltransferase [Psychromonas antarctica]MCG6201536.1 peptide chain release factor N(5)-glutamine methyltransferase [Psychromonas antarctica]